MTMPLVLVAVMVVLYTCGVYLMLDRTLTRLLLGGHEISGTISGLHKK